MSKTEGAVKKAAAAVAAQNPTTKVGETEQPKKVAVAGASSKLSHSFTDVANAVDVTYKNYFKTLTPRLKLIDLFLVFLVALGVLQFIYVLLIGNFPFNAFLGGFIACVGQFVLTVSLRMQYATIEIKAAKETEKEDDTEEETFATISPERAFGDYIFASLILHFIVFHFIN